MFGLSARTVPTYQRTTVDGMEKTYFADRFTSKAGKKEKMKKKDRVLPFGEGGTSPSLGRILGGNLRLQIKVGGGRRTKPVGTGGTVGRGH